MVNWQEAGKTSPQPHPHAVHLLPGLVWDQHYRHSNPQCEGGMPGSFKLREDMGADRLQAVENRLQAGGYAYRCRHKRWRVWTRPDRPGEELHPDGIEDDGNPNEYPSGATINVSIWDMIEKKFCGPGEERTLQGGSSASPGKERRSAGDSKQDKKWREYHESLAAEDAEAAENENKGGTLASSHEQASGSHHLGHTTKEVAKKAKAKPRQLHLKKSDPSSDLESAHRGRRPTDEASSSSSVAPDQRDVARACERACGVPCNLRGARKRATEQNAAEEGAVGIAWQEAAEWGTGMAFHAWTVAAIAAGVTVAAAQEAAAAWVRSAVEAAAQEAAAAKEALLAKKAIARREAEVKALEEALAKERAREEAEERAHAEAMAKAHADAANRDATEAARRKVTEERATTEAELAALEAEKARLQQAREAEAACAREEAEGRAAAAAAAAIEEAEAKLRRETPPGGSLVETLQKLFEGDASSKMKLDLEEDDIGSSGDSGPTTHWRRKGKGKTPERARRPADGYHHDSDPFSTASDGDGRDRRHHRGMAGGGGGDVPMESEGEDGDPTLPYRSSEPGACRIKAPRSGDMDEDEDMDFGYREKSPSSDPPGRPDRDPPGPPG